MRTTDPVIPPAAASEETATTQTVLAFEDNKLASMLFGQYGQNLALIERRLGVVAEQRGNHVTIDGSRGACEQARRVLEGLYEQLKRGHDLSQGDVDGAIRQAIAQGSLFDYDPAAPRPAFEEINLRKRPVRARTAAQDAYIRALKRHSLVFGTGPAGTGKTWLAVAQAVQMFERKEVDRIILSRPAVEAGERLGFLPGDMREKVDPYLRPIYDALYDLMDARIVERALQAGEIEIAPLAFMRGRTLSNAAVILDEAQNTTSMQMKMFLTRLGENSRMIVTGDPSQVDLPPGQKSGLAEAVKLLAGIENVGHVAFTHEDVIRHELVARIVEAYDRGTARARGQGMRPTPERRASPPQIDIQTQSPLWKAQPLAEQTVRDAVTAAASALSTADSEVSIVLTDDSAMAVLNRDWRGIDKPTNVLSFPASGHKGSESSRFLGDIVIAYETLVRECDDEDRKFLHHLAHLAVHGFLHLVGYDHETDAQAEEMEGLESKIMTRMSMPDPYIARDLGDA